MATFKDVTSAVVSQSVRGSFLANGNEQLRWETSQGRGGRAKEANQGGDNETVSRRGNFVPYVKGTARVAPVVFYVADPQQQAAAGAFNVSSAAHAIASAGTQQGFAGEVGQFIHRIWIDGRLVLGEELNNGPITPFIIPGTVFAPSGSFVSVLGSSVAGRGFYIHWGDINQAVDPLLPGASFYNFGSRFPGLMYAHWVNVPVSYSTRQQLEESRFPKIEYEISVGNSYFSGGLVGPAGLRWWHHGLGAAGPFPKPESDVFSAGLPPVPGYRYRMSWGSALSEILFANYPAGLGFASDTSGLLPKWSTDSINVADAVLHDDTNEIQYTTLHAKDGTPAADLIGGLLQDAGAACRWNNVLGQYEVKLIRNEPGSLPTITADMLVGPRPEISFDHSEEKIESIMFTFNDETRGHKQTIIPVVDDSAAYNQSRIGGSIWALAGPNAPTRRAKTVPITTTTHHLTAQKVAIRRAREEISGKNVYKLRANRDAWTIHPGDQFYVEGLPGPLLAYRCTIDPEGNGTVEINAMESFHADTIDIVPPSSAGENHQEVIVPSDQPDVRCVELSGYRGGATEQGLYIINRQPDFSAFEVKIWISQDNITYKDTGEVLTRFGFAGGDLTSALGLGGAGFLANGPTLLADSETDADAWGEILSPTGSGYFAGDQMALINDELFYVGQLTALGGSSYRLDNITRAAYESFRGNHLIGDGVWLFRTDQIPLLRDSFFQPDQQIWVKLQGVRNGIARDLSTVTAIDCGQLCAPGIRLMDPEALDGYSPTTGPGSGQYATGETITLDWSYRSYLAPDPPSPISSDTDTYTSGPPPIQEEFTVEALNALGGAVLNTYTVVGARTFSYTPAQRLADYGSTDPVDVFLKVNSRTNLVIPSLRSKALREIQIARL